jgi:inner membrane protein
MDNLTHSLIGLMSGEVVARSTSLRSPDLSPDTRRVALITVGVVANNLPDVDLLAAYPGFHQDKLAYLLQHRGYTHTLVGCVVLALLLYAAVDLWARLRHLPLARADRLVLACTALLGVLTHLGMDALNSYGVHPLWPFDNHWYYGDSIFIVEPLYWVALGPLWFGVRTRAARVLLGVALLAAMVINVIANPAQKVAWLLVPLLTATLVFVGGRSSRRIAAWTSVAAAIAVTAVFAGAGRLAAGEVRAIAAADFPGDITADQVLSPTPMNPFCWDLLLVQSRGGRYVVRHATLSIAPGVVAASQCPRLLAAERTTAPLTTINASTFSRVQWLGQFSMPLTEMNQVMAAHCDAMALMQFARAPFVASVNGQWAIGDLRFDRETGLGMAEIDVGPLVPAACPNRAPWIPPRRELFDALP